MTQLQEKKSPFNYRILVVDDEARIRDACQRMLTREGFKVAVAETGEIGMKMIDADHFDIILLDLMMPGLSGLNVLPHLKRRHPYSVVIVITGYATLEHSIEAMKRGAFDFIPKPFSPADLRSVITKAIEFIRTLQDIANEKSRMGVMINQLSGGVMATDIHKRVALANSSFLKMVDHFGGEVIGLPAAEVARCPRIEEMIDEALAMPEEELYDITAEMETGGKVIGIRCVPFRDRLGRNLGTITVVNDITALKKMDQLKSDFVSMVAHEIRSPLNTIGMQLSVILDGLAGEVSEKQRELLGRAAEKIRTLSSLSTELLDLARIESDLISQEKERLDIGHLMSEQVTFYREAAQAKDIRLTLSDLPPLPPVLANRQNMDEVISNLVSNAIRYTPDGGRITVSAEPEENHLHIRVTDTGFGIDEADMERIFERFFRVKNEDTRFITGTGLGLPIVKSILEAHNGKIEVTSRPGEGSTFHAYLPVIVT